jgi:hypothetical protein
MKASLKGNTLTIEFELEKGSRSNSGKSLLVYTTKGFKPVEGTELKISINVIGKRLTA